MIELTPEQIVTTATAAQTAMLEASDRYINDAIEALGVSPCDVSDEQYNEILDMIFG